MRWALALILTFGCGTAHAQWHSMDTTPPHGNIALSELLRCIQFFNFQGLHNAAETEDGYAPGAGEAMCEPHDLDYSPQNWVISFNELLRAIQYFNASLYKNCLDSEDGYCPGSSSEDKEYTGGVIEGTSEGSGEGNLERILEGATEGEEEGASVDELVAISAGSFEMGRPYTDTGHLHELPVHTVYLDAYLIGKYEVTNQQMADVLNWAYGQGYLESSAFGGAYNRGLVYGYGKQLVETDRNTSYSSIEFSGCKFRVQSRLGAGDQIYSMAAHPVVQITWFGCVAYCNWRSEMEGLDSCYDFSDWSLHSPVRNGYRLPTEAEWERAAAWDGERHWRYGYTSDAISTAEANYMISDRIHVNPLGLIKEPYTSPVGWFNGINVSPNGSIQTQDSHSPAGAYDMSGNVSEWCHDWSAVTQYDSTPASNPLGPTSGTFRRMRGGDWLSFDYSARASYRVSYPPQTTDFGSGMRVARTP